MVAYQFALLYPEKISGVLNLSVPFLSEAISVNTMPEGFCMLRWLVPGRAEADFGRFDVKQNELLVAAEDQEIMDLVDASSPLPTWFSEEGLTAYAALYENSGLQNPKVQVPALLIMGEKDYSGTVKNYVPDLDIKFMPEGSHFVQEQFPEEVNQFLLSFLKKHSPELVSCITEGVLGTDHLELSLNIF
ncbi:unnamed protein product [Spirodela intermedia]|uniref:Uncharacterized protein n=1 Tax=Spirodela intermedia TaxID=51605 RepID=A0A7I8IE74_SPIIN|nr:unnamed protein product [Spirodela intermedia]CAA6655684.1 unnamed protein product [Spirodela intermedia]